MIAWHWKGSVSGKFCWFGGKNDKQQNVQMFEKIFTSNIHSCIIKEMMEVKEMELRHGLSIQEKLRILADAAKYDVACTSRQKGKEGFSGEFQSLWNLSQFFSRWQMYLVIESTDDESLCLRLQILCKQGIE